MQAEGWQNFGNSETRQEYVYTITDRTAPRSIP